MYYLNIFFSDVVSYSYLGLDGRSFTRKLLFKKKTNFLQHYMLRTFSKRLVKRSITKKINSSAMRMVLFEIYQYILNIRLDGMYWISRLLQPRTAILDFYNYFSLPFYKKPKYPFKIYPFFLPINLNFKGIAQFSLSSFYPYTAFFFYCMGVIQKHIFFELTRFLKNIRKLIIINLNH